MYRIIDGRGTGKTSRLLLLAKEHDGIVVCAYPEWMKEKAYKYGLVGINFISYSDFIKGIMDNNVKMNMFHPDGEISTQEITLPGFHSEKPVFVDDLEKLFNHLCVSKFLGYTISNED